MKADPREDPKSIGRILVDRGIVTPWQLAQAVDLMRRVPGMRLGDAVVELEYAERVDVERAYQRQLFMRARKVDEKIDTAHNVIGMAEAQNVRAANSIASAYDRADAVVRRLSPVRRKTGGA